MVVRLLFDSRQQASGFPTPPQLVEHDVVLQQWAAGWKYENTNQHWTWNPAGDV